MQEDFSYGRGCMTCIIVYVDAKCEVTSVQFCTGSYKWSILLPMVITWYA